MFKNHPKGLPVLFFTEMWERFGFYTTRLVEAPSRDEAERFAVESLRQEDRLRGRVLNHQSDPPMLFVEEIDELSPAEAVEDRALGLAFYEEKPAAH